MKKFDIIIIGAGIAGLSSTLTAVNLGLRTALIEKEDFIGGIAKDCFHTHICGLFKNDPTLPFQIANPGICSDIVKFFKNIYGTDCLVQKGKVETLLFNQKDLWNFFLESLKKDNFSLFSNSSFKKIISNNKTIKQIHVQTKQKDTALTSDAFINASGCRTAFNSAKADPSDNNSQLGGYCILLEGTSTKDLSLLVPYHARKIVKKYKLKNYLKFTTITYNFLSNTHTLKFSVRNQNDMEPSHFIFDQLKKIIPELDNLKFLKSSRNIYLRNCDHYTDPNQDENCIALSYWPVEKWDVDKGTQYEYIKNNKPFCIPISAIKDNKFNNLFHAGKSIRVSEQIHASARVMGVCMATGESAAINAYNYIKKR